MMTPDSWMTNDATLRLIAEVRGQLELGADKVRVAVALRKQTSPEKGTFVLSQAELQIRARKKFVNADQMLFTKIGLEQATSEVISEYKSTLIEDKREVFDICCGIGGDSIGLGKRGNLTSVDQDEVTCVLARHNLGVNAIKHFEVITTKFAELKLPEDAFVHIDPDRRTKGRTIRAENFSPTLDAVVEKLMGANSKRTVCIKLAPATRLEQELSIPHRKHWIGHQRECKQQLLWLGGSKTENSDCVTVIDGEGHASSLEISKRRAHQLVSPAVDSYIYEPHSAVLGADLVDEFAESKELGRLSYGSVYLTGSQLLASPFAAGFRILERCSMKAKVIKSVLKEHDFGEIEWKSRGLDQKTVARLSKTKGTGARKGVVILTRMGEQFVCFVCERV